MLTAGVSKYVCMKCKKEFHYTDVYRSWKCPECQGRIKLRVEIKGYLQTCFVMRANELKKGMLVTLDNTNIHEVLAIEKKDTGYRIALKEYKAIVKGKEEEFMVIMGAWPD